MFFWFLEIAWSRALPRLDLHSNRDVGGAT
jgi:hypothetical protein